MEALIRRLQTTTGSTGGVGTTGVTPTNRPTTPAPTLEDDFDDLSSGAIFSLVLGGILIATAIVYFCCHHRGETAPENDLNLNRTRTGHKRDTWTTTTNHMGPHTYRYDEDGRRVPLERLPSVGENSPAVQHAPSTLTFQSSASSPGERGTVRSQLSHLGSSYNYEDTFDNFAGGVAPGPAAQEGNFMEMTRQRRQHQALRPTWSSSGRQTGGVRPAARTEEEIAHAIVPGADFDVVAAARQFQAHRSLAGDALRRALEEADMTTDDFVDGAEEFGEQRAALAGQFPPAGGTRSFRSAAAAPARAPVVHQVAAVRQAAPGRTRGRRHSLAGGNARVRQAPPERARPMRRGASMPAMSRNGRPLRRMSIGSSF